MSYLIDTSWVVEYTRNNQNAITRLSAMRDEGLAISIISVAELYRGVFLSTNITNNESSLNDFLNEIVVLDLDQDIARIFGREDARLRRIGRNMGSLDLLIAATALHYDLTLLTTDRDFERVENLQLVFL